MRQRKCLERKMRGFRPQTAVVGTDLLLASEEHADNLAGEGGVHPLRGLIDEPADQRQQHTALPIVVTRVEEQVTETQRLATSWDSVGSGTDSWVRGR